MATELPPNAPDLSATQYVLEKLIGEGGFGQAYLAYNQGLRRRCVLKVLTDTTNTGFVARFFREAQVMANLEHPTIPRVYEVATTKAGQPYFAMEYIDGKSLGDHLADEGGTLPITESCRLVADAAEGLAAAHDIGVVHRDVKLANLLINKRGQIKVIDFGISKKTIQEGDLTPGILTAVGQLFGTPRYMSPEQAMAKPIGPPSDFYSLGVVLFILLTGRSPFNGTPHEMMTGHVRELAPTLAAASSEDFPPAVEALMARLLAKNPAARFDKGAELAAMLRSVAGLARSGYVGVDSGRPSSAGGDAVTRESMLSPQPPPELQGTPMKAEPTAVGSARSPQMRRTDLKLGETVRQMLTSEASIAVQAINVGSSPDAHGLADANTAFGPAVVSQSLSTGRSGYAPSTIPDPRSSAESFLPTQLDLQPVTSPPRASVHGAEASGRVSATWGSGAGRSQVAYDATAAAMDTQTAANPLAENSARPSMPHAAATVPMPQVLLRREDSASAPLQAMAELTERTPPKSSSSRVPFFVFGALALVAGSIVGTKLLLSRGPHPDNPAGSTTVGASTESKATAVPPPTGLTTTTAPVIAAEPTSAPSAESATSAPIMKPGGAPSIKAKSAPTSPIATAATAKPLTSATATVKASATATATTAPSKPPSAAAAIDDRN